MHLTQAILPVAGLGTRFLPWTKSVPKEMLPIGNRPMIALLVDECLDAGITDICFVISKGKEQIPAYFEHDERLHADLTARGKDHLLEEIERYDNVRFHTVYQDQQLGDGHAILQAAGWVDSDHVAVLFGDDFFTGAESGIEQLKRAHGYIEDDLHGAFLALENVPKEDTAGYGIVEVDPTPPRLRGASVENEKNPRLKKIKSLVEKPDPKDAPSTLGIVGRYLIPQEVFEVLPTVSAGEGGEIRLIDALIAKLGDIPIYGYECEGTRIDTGTPEGYREALKTLEN